MAASDAQPDQASMEVQSLHWLIDVRRTSATLLPRSRQRTTEAAETRSGSCGMILTGIIVILALIAIWLGAAALVSYRLGLSLRQAMLYAPLRALYRI